MSRQLGPGELSASERTILHLLANGRSPTALAIELGLALDTIRRHRGTALRKLGAADLPGAVLAAFHRGILRPDEIVTGPYRWILQLADAQAKLAAVRELHRPWKSQATGQQYCNHCDGDMPVTYPCDTIQAIGEQP